MSEREAGNAVQRAVSAFERAHDLLLTVHDLRGDLWPRLADRHRWHRHPHCQAVKSAGGLGRCRRFDSERVFREAADWPEGRIQHCHAGVVECLLPVFVDRVLVWTLFAGARRPGRGLRLDVAVSPDRDLPALPSELPELDAEQAWIVLESLRQLAARLRELCAGGARAQTARERRAGSILSWLDRHHAQSELRLGDLATWLQVGEGQAGRIVRQCFDITFPRLLARVRIEHACSLLRESQLDLLRIAQACGYADLSTFHRQFKAALACSPTAWRQRPGGWP